MEFGHVEMHQQQSYWPDNMTNINGFEEWEGDLTLEASIEKIMLQQQPPNVAEWSIYRVPKRLLNMNCKAYVPEVITIGPFHHCQKADVMATQRLKLLCLNSYLHRINWRVEDVVGMARDWECRARSCYAEPINMNSDDFVKMMLLDGCFIVELIILANDQHFEAQNRFDLSFFKPICFDLYRDLTMLENQLPFFVLQGLFDLVPLPQHRNKDAILFIQLMAQFLSNGLIRQYWLPDNVLFSQNNTVKHLVDLLSFFYVPSDDTEEYMRNTGIGTKSFLLPPTVTQLRKAGVKVKKATEAKSLMDISFQDGVLQIPPFEIHDDFEIFVRNLMAFELYRVQEDGVKYALHYIEFLDGLISTGEDVALLVKEEIITNLIGGSDQEVSELFNNLCKYTFIPHDFYYYGTSKNLHAHCGKWRHRTMATLRRDYFNNPWSYISFVAATFLILLTFLQTLFSALSISH